MTEATIGVIGGSGLYAMPGLADVEQVALQTPFGSPSDTYVVGTLGGQRVAFLPRHGLGHRLTPSEVPSRANIFGFKQLGVKALIAVSAVGSLREDYAPGQLVVPTQLFDRTKGIRPASFFGEGIVAHVPFDKPFDPALSAILFEAAQRAGAAVHFGGTYTCMEGPQFSTLAESEENRRAGFDLVGMTALPEAKLAREAEIPYAMFAMVTDYDCWHPSHDAVTVEMVVATMHKNTAAAQQSIAQAIPAIAAGFDSPAYHALAGAIMTAPEAIPAERRQALALLVGKYLG
ncbi:S-methyl-5'-thioadenosine phosphorylase [Chloroflexia bacterium SDU3-3]|nr:S-methyl-5'-thioadenosine phosphorylase [Chloroflexia bacterium SDU3-3]